MRGPTSLSATSSSRPLPAAPALNVWCRMLTPSARLTNDTTRAASAFGTGNRYLRTDATRRPRGVSNPSNTRCGYARDMVPTDASCTSCRSTTPDRLKYAVGP